MSESKRSKRTSKPAKPYPEFPLSAHPCGQWCKRIKGTLYYFGVWDDWKAALATFKSEVDFIQVNGHRPDPSQSSNALTVQQLCNQFLAAKQLKLEAGELTERSFTDYMNTCKRLCKIIDKKRSVDSLAPAVFTSIRESLNTTLSNRSVANEIGRIRMVFFFGEKQGLIPSIPKYGESFEKPSKKSIRTERRKKPNKFFTPEQLQQIIETADQPLKAMILLALNSGMGNADVGRLQFSEIDFSTGWIDSPRHKTEAPRRFPMWAETIEALKEAISLRPVGGHELEVFCTSRGQSWFKETPDSPISKKFRLHLIDLEMHTKGVGFYALRHCFETYAANAGMNQKLIDSIMGHLDESMAAEYREFLSDERLQQVVDAVRAKVFGQPEKEVPNG